jgi:hypothetical protein
MKQGFFLFSNPTKALFLPLSLLLSLKKRHPLRDFV